MKPASTARTSGQKPGKDRVELGPRARGRTGHLRLARHRDVAALQGDALLGGFERVACGRELAGDGCAAARVTRAAERVDLLQLSGELRDPVAQLLHLPGGGLLGSVVLPVDEGLGVGVRDLLRALRLAVERLDVDQARPGEDLEAHLVLEL